MDVTDPRCTHRCGYPGCHGRGEAAGYADGIAEVKQAIAETVVELVEMATDPQGPTAEWISLIKDVADGKYTPPVEIGRTP